MNGQEHVAFIFSLAWSHLLIHVTLNEEINGTCAGSFLVWCHQHPALTSYNSNPSRQPFKQATN